MRKVWTAVAVVVAAALLGCGVSSNGGSNGPVVVASGTAAAPGSKAPAGPMRFKVGETGSLTLENGSTGQVVVNSVKVQGKFLVASVTITCTAGGFDYNPFDWSALAGDGTKLDTGFAMDVKNELHSGTLGAGQKVTGNLVWEGTAAQAKGMQIQYTSGLTTVAYWVAP